MPSTRNVATSLERVLRALAVAAACGLPTAAEAATCTPPVATMASVQGTVEVQHPGETAWLPVARNDGFCAGDTIRVGEKSRADLVQLDQTLLRLAAKTTLTLEGAKDGQPAVVDMVKGAAHFLSRSPAAVDVKTPFTVAGIRGTEFFVGVDDAKTELSVYDGRVVAANAAGSLTLGGGQSAVAEAGRAPVLRVVARPRDAVHWALYYPPVVYFRAEEFRGGPAWHRAVGRSLDFYGKGDLQHASEALREIPPDVRDARLAAYRASLLLAVGSVDEADAEIARALQADPQASDALALQAVIAVVQDDKSKALERARAAVAAAPRSASSLIALSYAQQATFDLEGARESLDQAVALAPENALAWARLAEIRASFGDLDGALAAARTAADLAPGLSRTQTVLGFAYLTQVKTDAAREAFDKAIALDQADPLPRLGHGLAEIRDGRLGNGSRELEVAASLDPNNSLVHSYLGKAYYEEKRTGLDERQYQIAKELDPNDPTPWFYDAIQKQTTNRPVEALRDFQTAIDLNDNRAVYRSRLLLDSDLAARSASLGRIYSDLGFQPLALVEGWKSVNTDPTNYSAHRFLADSYSVLPRHEIARVSELLQSQLLQPTNITPIQPRLAESNLFLISAGGPGTQSFNEFNPLFNRNGATVQLSGLVGELDTWAEEFVVSGIAKKLSLSVGQTYFETDGFRSNADQKDQLVTGFAQLEITPQTSIQVEGRYKDEEKGDLQQRFLKQFFSTLRDEQERYTGRVGGRHAFGPNSILLGSFIYQDADTRLTTDDFPEPGDALRVKIPETSFGGELQHLFRSRYVNLRSGLGDFAVDAETKTTIAFPPAGPDEPPFTDVSTTDEDQNHFNAYAYADIRAMKNLTATVGGSFDHLTGDADDKDQFNPKFGVTWNPFPSTTVRGAVLRTLKRTLITDQTLEPTNVAGFNQFFDDPNLTESWRYGAAIDQKFSSTVFGGIEFSKRDLTVPFLEFQEDSATLENRKVDWDEYTVPAYLFWTPHQWVALQAQYIWERLDRDERFAAGASELDTHRVPLGVRFFHPSGLSASLTATYWYQDGTFEDFLTHEPRPGQADFWTVDAGVSYRLPKRYGFVTVGATNIADEHFKFFDVDMNNPTIQPERMVFARVTLAFP